MGLRDTSWRSQHFLFRKPARLLQMRPSSGTSIPRQPHVPGGRSNEMKLPSSARHQAPLPARPPLPVSHPPVLPEATPSPGVPTPAFRTRCLPSGPCAGSPASRRWGSRLPLLPLQPPPPPRAPSTDPASCPLDSIPGPVLRPGPWGTRAAHLGAPSCSPSGPSSFWPARRTLRLPAPLFPSDCQRAPRRPHPGRSRSAKPLGLHFPDAEDLGPGASFRVPPPD